MSTRLRRTTILMALFAGLASVPATASADTCPGLNGKIAVVSGAGSTDDIEIVGPWEGTVRPLFPPPEVSVQFTAPSFSCDGRRIIYHGNNGGPNFIEVADAISGQKIPPGLPGGGRRFPQPPFPMTGMNPTDPTYLSNGKIVFTSLPAEGYSPPGTYIVNQDGSGLHRLFPALSSAVSSDGRWFIAGYEGRSLSVSVRNAGGRKVRWSTLSLGGSRNPSFSADGGQVVFERDNDLYIVDTDGTDRRRLTHDGRSGNPVFSPNGQWIAFTRWHSVPGLYKEVVALSLERSPRVRVVARLPQAESIGELAWAVR
jgi:Tol biopolymer transport system component